MSQGTIRSIKDLVVRVQFDAEAPDSGEVVIAENDSQSILLVDSLSSGGMALCLNVYGDRSLQKGMSVKTTGKGIEIPVGDKAIGRIFDALGRPLDGLPPITGADLIAKDI